MGDATETSGSIQPEFENTVPSGESVPFHGQIRNMGERPSNLIKVADEAIEGVFDVQPMMTALPMHSAGNPYIDRRHSTYDIPVAANIFMPANDFHMHQVSQYPAQRGHVQDGTPMARAQQQHPFSQQPFGIANAGHFPMGPRHPLMPMHSPVSYAHADSFGFGSTHPQYPPLDVNHGHQPFPNAFGSHGDLAGSFGQYIRRSSESNTAIPSFPRGPPRKPKQSGHALWVGNLPPAATVTDLKDFFSRDATKDIESLFLISKSNCAFVNYRTQAACIAAMNRFHDSRFHGVRLVCRLRRGSTTITPISPSAGESPDVTSAATSTEDQVDSTFSDIAGPIIVGGAIPARKLSTTEDVKMPSTGSPKAPEKFFIVKSLTLQDLEASVRNGIWATQSHNEAAFNRAFEEAENVYLIFSANKSGEYFGYARMASQILGEPLPIDSSPPATTKPKSDGPKSIMTPATETAPTGRIIDDSARGTIFWEADLSDGKEDDSPIKETAESAQDLGRPFKIEWISVARVPFYRTRGLRNPWNANREVKIARDGTELEPSIGKRLIQMFHRPSQPILSPVMVPGMVPF